MNTSIQENAVLHSTVKKTCRIGKNVILGHSCNVHGPCKVGDFSLVGINATVLMGAELGSGCVLAGGSVLKGKSEDNCLYAGIPAIKKKVYKKKRMSEWGTNLYVENGKKFKNAGLSQKIPEEFVIP